MTVKVLIGMVMMRNGYDRNGFDVDGYNDLGYDREGYDREGYDREGFTRSGIKRGQTDLGIELVGESEEEFDENDEPIMGSPPPLSSELTYDDVKNALKQNNGNRTQTAKALGISVRSLYRAMKRLNIYPY